jgi:membrane fusion protein (multidrug efflux system)
VNENDLLVTLDVTDLQAQEKQATAALASARQNLALSKINRDKTKSDTDRVAKLYANAATTREAYDHAVNALEASEAQLSLAQAQVDTSAAQLGVINAQILNATIRTPISGTVNRITLHEGDLAQPGQTILDVNNLDDIWVTANLEETKIGRIKTGAKVKITVDAYPHRAFDGTVEMIRAGIVAPAFQIGEFTKTTQRIPVKIKLARTNEGFILLPGMSAEVKIRTTTGLPDFLSK